MKHLITLLAIIAIIALIYGLVTVARHHETEGEKRTRLQAEHILQILDQRDADAATK
jgi:hypothetical protein